MAAVADCQGAGLHVGQALVRSDAVEHQHAAAKLGQAARSIDIAAELVAVGHRVDPRIGIEDHVPLAVERGPQLQAAAVEMQRGRGIADGAVGRDAERAGVDRCVAGIAARAVQQQPAGACLDETAGAADRPGIGHVVGPVEDQGAVVEHVALQRTGRASIAQAEGAVADPRSAGIGLVGGPGQRIGAELGDAAGAADGAGVDQVVAAVEHQRAVVEDVADHAAAGAAIAQLQGAGGDRGAAGIGVVRGQHHGAGAQLLQAAAAADDAVERDRVGAVEGQHACVPHIALDAAAAAAIADLQRSSRDVRAARVGVLAGQYQGAGTLLGQGSRPIDLRRHRGAETVRVEISSQRTQGDQMAGRQIETAAPAQGALIEEHAVAAGAERVVGLRFQHAAKQADHAGEAVGSVQRQRARADLDQVPGAGDRSIPGQRGRGGGVQYRRAAQLQAPVAGKGGGRAQGRRLHRHAGTGGAQCGVGTDLQYAGVDRRAAAVGVGAFEYQRAAAGLGQRGRTAAIDDLRGHGRGGVAVHAQAEVGCGQHAAAAADHAVAIGYELHAGRVHVLDHRDGARGALEHREALAPRRIDRTIGGGPVRVGVVPHAGAAVDDAVADGLRTIPELQAEAAGDHDQVDLVGDAGLHLQRGGKDPRRQQAKLSPLSVSVPP